MKKYKAQENFIQELAELLFEQVYSEDYKRKKLLNYKNRYEYIPK